MAAGALSLAASAFASPKRTGREGSSSGPLPCLLRRPISSSSLSSLQFPSLYISTVELNNRPNRLSVHCTGSSSSPPPPPRKSSTTVSTKLYVSGLSFRTTEESLRNAFQDFGQLVEVNLVMDRVANRPRGFAFLRYATEEESKKAIEGMHGKFLDGRVIFVEVAKPRSELQQESKQILR